MLSVNARGEMVELGRCSYAEMSFQKGTIDGEKYICLGVVQKRRLSESVSTVLIVRSNLVIDIFIS